MTVTVDLADPEVARTFVRGALELEPTPHGLLPQRLPRRARDQGDGQLQMAASQPSGVRVAVRTAATWLELDVVPTKRVYAGAPPRPDGVFDLLVDGRLHAQGTVAGGHTVSVDLGRGAVDRVDGEPGTLRLALPEGEHDVEVWLPHDETTELVALRADAPLTPAEHERRTWVHHGSSLSQGSGAAGPSRTWVGTAAVAAGVELVNLGLGGSMMLDPSLARTLRDTRADVLSAEVGINIVNGDVMRLRAFTAALHGFVDTVREGHPDAALLLVTPLLCPMHEETPGPSELDPEALAQGRLAFRAAGDPAEVPAGRLTLQVIRTEMERVVAQRRDPHLHLLDGRELYGADDATARPLPDGLHPDAETHRIAGERFAELAFGPAGALA